MSPNRAGEQVSYCSRPFACGFDCRSPQVFVGRSFEMALLIGSVLILGGLSDAKAAPADLPALVESEKNFAQTAQEHGVREAFLQFLADDSVLFIPEPTNGKAFYAKVQEKGRRLIWRPIFATISAAGDLGVTTGPWELKKSPTDDTAMAFGQFLTVWKKQADGSWKVALDLGTENPKPKDNLASDVRLLPPESGSSIAKDTAQTKLAEAEKNLAEGHSSLASDDLRVMRENSFPVLGKDAAAKLVSSNDEKITRTKLGGGISASHDLAYTFGSFTSETSAPAQHGHFVSIWRADAKGDWKLLIDLEKQEPPVK